jgi:hypothetical protein
MGGENHDQSKHVDQDTCFTNYTSITSRAFATSLILEFVGETRGSWETLMGVKRWL